MKIEHCRSCRAEIVWLKTSKGKDMPVDAETVKIDETFYEPKHHVSHFATCPEAKKWRVKP